MSHTYHAIGCTRVIPPERLMCFPHWTRVPKVIQRDIWRTYRHGQEKDWKPSAEYCTAAKAAVRAVAGKEGRTITGDEPELKMYDIFTPEAGG